MLWSGRLSAKAEKGDGVAQWNLGCCYYEGWGVTRDDAEAVDWFRKAAAKNCAGAQYNLGECYYGGLGVAKDYVEAVNGSTKLLCRIST